MSAEKIRKLNDAFRRSLTGGKVMMTAGIAALSVAMQAKVLNEVRTFDAFTADNDPHGEHDFGNFEVDGRKIFWKIDYYDAAMEFGSEDPADPSKTTRVLTVMLASEY
jgi:Protein of unknown function (DUF3768)